MRPKHAALVALDAFQDRPRTAPDALADLRNALTAHFALVSMLDDVRPDEPMSEECMDQLDDAAAAEPRIRDLLEELATLTGAKS